MSNRSNSAAAICCATLFLTVLATPALGLAQDNAQTAAEAARNKVLMQEKAAREANEGSLQKAQRTPMKLRGRNKAGECPEMDNKGPGSANKKLNP